MLRIGCGVLLAMGFAGPAFAQTAEDSTFISGTIDEVCTVDTDVSQATINLASGGAQEVTGVTYTCNSVGGFTRTITSQNGGALVRGNQSIPYTIAHTGAAGLSFGSSALSSPLISNVPSSVDVTEGSAGTLTATVPNLPANLLAGEYSDVVTIAITSN